VLRLKRGRQKDAWAGSALFCACVGVQIGLAAFRLRAKVGSEIAVAPKRVSRGKLIDDFLRGRETPEEFASKLEMVSASFPDSCLDDEQQARDMVISD
jgi:hypothetical protein